MPSKETSAQEAQRVQRVAKALRDAYPDARCGLNFGSPFQLLVATMLSAQCTDKCVNQVTSPLFTDASTPEAILRLGEEGLRERIRACGLAPTKSKNIIATCRLLIANHGGQVPADLESLTALPGVGRKTANVVLANAFGRPAFAVDTHVFRVSRRLGLAAGKNPAEVETELTRAIPPPDWLDTHHQLIAHGRRLCSARAPRCQSCPLAVDCPSAGIFPSRQK
jgi:endonuclease-3